MFGAGAGCVIPHKRTGADQQLTKGAECRQALSHRPAIFLKLTLPADLLRQ